MQNRIFSFPPLIDSLSQVLVLGSIPGAKSLEKNQYYAHPQNQFWKIMCDLLGVNYTTVYTERLELIQQHNIALWDIIESCERQGSLDATIKNERIQNLPMVLDGAPRLRGICCNGQKAYKTTLKIIGKDFSLPIISLPSTSPLHTIPYQEKLQKWEILLQFIT